MQIVWLVRHAQSEANAGGRTADPAQIPITPIGQEQSRHLALAVASPPQLVITSAYLRTKQTAQPLLQRFPQIQQMEWPVHEFTYLSVERCRNTTMDERWPWVVEYWERNDPAYVDGGGAESFIELQSRVEHFLESLKALDQDFTVVFSHGQFIRSLLWRLLGGQSDCSPGAMKDYRKFITSFEFPNAAVVKLRLEDGSVWISPVDSSYIPVELRTS